MAGINVSVWVVLGPDLRRMLERAHAGEDPGVLYLEMWANSSHEVVEPDEGA